MKPEPVPDLDWEPKRARELGEAALDIWEELLERIRELPVSRYEGVDAVREAVALDVPEEPMPVEDLVGYLRSVVLDHSMYPGHPGFMAYVSGTGTVPGAAADLVAAGLNQNVGGWRLSPAASEIEHHLTRWFAERFGLPEGSGGLIVSGGAMACFIGLKLARDRKAGWNVRTEGLLAGPPLRIYASSETHSVNYRAADMMGLGRNAVRSLPVDEGYRLRADEMRRAIEEDLAAGLRPIAVVGSVGTVATGAVDPLEEIADLAGEFGLWSHVDGACGGPASLAEELRPLLVGVERADSIAFDPHKWLYTPHSGGCILVRDFEDLPRSFSIAEYSAYVDALNERLMTAIQMDGRVYPSNAVLNGRFVLRSCIVNFRTEAEEIDLLLDVAAELGSKLDSELRPAGLTAGRTG